MFSTSVSSIFPMFCGGSVGRHTVTTIRANFRGMFVTSVACIFALMFFLRCLCWLSHINKYSDDLSTDWFYCCGVHLSPCLFCGSFADGHTLTNIRMTCRGFFLTIAACIFFLCLFCGGHSLAQISVPYYAKKPALQNKGREIMKSNMLANGFKTYSFFMS